MDFSEAVSNYVRRFPLDQLDARATCLFEGLPWGKKPFSFNVLGTYLNQSNDNASKAKHQIRDEISLLRDNEVLLDRLSMIDVGCGVGLHAEEMSSWFKGEYLGCDINPSAVEYAEQQSWPLNFKFICEDFFTFTISKKFDVVFAAYDFVNHLSVEKLRLFLSRCDSLLSEKGVIVLEVASNSSILNKHELKYTYFKDLCSREIAEETFFSASKGIWGSRYFLPCDNNRIENVFYNFRRNLTLDEILISLQDYKIVFESNLNKRQSGDVYGKFIAFQK